MKHRYFQWIGGIVAILAIILMFAWYESKQRGQPGENDKAVAMRLIDVAPKDQKEFSGKGRPDKRPRTWRRETPKAQMPVEPHANERQLFDFDGILDSVTAKKMGLNSEQIASIGEAIGKIEDDIVKDFFDSATREPIGNGEEILVHSGGSERAKELYDKLKASILMILHENPEKERILVDILSGMKDLRCLNFSEGDMLGIRVMAAGADKEDSGNLRVADAMRICLKPNGYIEHSRKFGWPNKEALLISNGRPIEVWEEY